MSIVKRLPPRISAGGGAALLALGSLFGAIADGTGSDAAAAGVRSYINLALMAMSGRVLPVELFNLARSGDTLDLAYDRIPYATGQAPTILGYFSEGHNDALMTTDPTSAPGIALMAKWTRNKQRALDDALPATQKIILATTIGSLVSGEATHAAAVNAAQKAWINAAAATDPRVILWDAWALFNHTNCTNLSPDAQKEHPDNRGAWQLVFGDGTNSGLFDILNALCVPATVADVQAWLDANTTNLDTDILLSGGTTGNKTGTPPPSGQWPTGKAIANGLTNGTGVAVVASIIDQTGHKQARASVSGTPAASGLVTMNDTANITLTGSTPGMLYAAATRFKLDDGAGGGAKGVVNWSLALGSLGTIGNTTDQSSVITGDIPAAIDWILVTPSFPLFNTSGPGTANPSLIVRGRGGVAQDWECTIEKPRVFRTFATPRTAPVPVWKAAGVPTANMLQRLTGTYSNGSSLRVDPGWWAGGGLDNTTFTERKIYEGAVGDTAVGSGTLRATLTGSTWTWTAAGLTPGNRLWVDVTATTVAGTWTERAGPYLVV